MIRHKKELCEVKRLFMPFEYMKVLTYDVYWN